MDVRFGNFEFSFDALKLRKDGLDVRLVGQPLHLLVMLLQHPGKVVTREEIRQRLWKDTHVDFDHSVHAALNRLRTTLRDTGKQPQFIETIPTVGYRFLAAVEVLAPVGATPIRAMSVKRRVMWFVLTAIVAALLALAVVRQHYDTFVPRAGQNAP